MSEELIKRLRGIALSKENTDFSYGRKAPLYGKETEIEWEAAGRIEELEQKLRTTSLEALAISDTNNELAEENQRLKGWWGVEQERVIEAEARLSEAVKVLERAMDKIDMQDVRLAVGEGKLSAADIMAGVNAVIRTRHSQAKAFITTLGGEK